MRNVYHCPLPITQTSSELGAGHSTELESQLSASQRQMKRLEDDLAEQKVGRRRCCYQWLLHALSVCGCGQWVSTWWR